MKIFILIFLMAFSVRASDTNYIGPVNARDTTWSNFYILDTERFFLNGQELFGSTAGVFQIWVGASNYYGNVYFSGSGVSVLNSTTIQFNAGQSAFTSAYSIAYSGATTNSLNIPLGASNSIVVSTGTNGGIAFATASSLGIATGTPVYADLGATGFVGDARLTFSYNPTTRTTTGSVSVAGLATGTPIYAETSLSNGVSQGQTANLTITNSGRQFYVTTSGFSTGTPLYTYTETDPVFTNAQHGGDVTGRYNAIDILGYDDNGPFSSPPSASGSNSVAIGSGSGASSDFGIAIGGSGCSVDLEGVAGGVFAGQLNAVGGTNSVICGGNNNIIAAETYDSFIGGGRWNEAPANSSSVIGGVSNVVSGAGLSFIGGGVRNFIQAPIYGSAIIAGRNNTLPAGGGSTTNTWGMIILGGISNSASGNSSAIISGFGNSIQNATSSYALGTLAYATNNGSFVFSDFNTSANYGSHGANTFNFRASGGVWHNDNQLIDGSGNILLARITNAANGVYATGTPLYVVSAGNVYTASNNAYSAGTTQSVYSLMLHTNGSVGMTGYAVESGNIHMQHKLVVPMGTNVYASVILGGQASTIGANAALVGIFSSDSSSISASDSKSVVIGGESLTINGDYNINAGGQNNDITGTHDATIAGLNNDISSGSYNGIFAGRNNAMSSPQDCFIGGGVGNDINTASDSAIVGGENNLIENGTGNDFIGGGENNSIYGNHSSIDAGIGNFIYSGNSHILGSYSMATGGLYQTAIGPGAHSRHSGSVVMSGHSDTPSSTNAFSTTTNQMVVSFPNGIGLQTNSAPAGGVNIGGTFQLRGIRQPICLGYFTNANPTTIVPFGQGDYFIDAGSNTVSRTFDGTTNGYRFISWSAY